MPKRLFVLWMMALAAGCGGGGGSSGSNPAPVAPPPQAPASSDLVILDGQPPPGAASAASDLTAAGFNYLGYSDFTLERSGACANGTTLTRSVLDLSVDFDTLFQEYAGCNVQPNAQVETTVTGTRADGSTFAGAYTFSTGSAVAQNLAVQDQVTVVRDAVQTLFRTYVDDSLFADLALPGLVEGLVTAAIVQIADTTWMNLVDPGARFDVLAERVAYSSLSPLGDAADGLTALVARPVPDATFTRRDRVIVMSHSTGVTPSELEAGNAWFVLATLFASQGYLVIAPDNFGRGGTGAEEETYLLGHRTARNTVDIVRAILAEPDYAEFVDADAPNIDIVGYSQGGHSAVAVWLALLATAPEIEVRNVYSGGAPHDLYRTVRGVVQHVNNSCDGDDYCRFVNDEVSVPFVTERILPPFLGYVGTGLTLNEQLAGDTLSEPFVQGFLANDSAYDVLKTAFLVNSFNNLTNAPEVFAGVNTRVVLYHSEFDRLVAPANSQALFDNLNGAVDVELRGSECNSTSYETIFNLTDFVGISHSLCGFEMIDDVYDALR